jgi:hypothetical protein
MVSVVIHSSGVEHKDTLPMEQKVSNLSLDPSKEHFALPPLT